MVNSCCSLSDRSRGTQCASHHLFEVLGVEKRSMAAAVLMLPPVVETGDDAVVAGFLESSFSLCS